MQRKQQHKNTYPKKKQETQHDTNTNSTIVSHNINHDTNIPTSSTSNIQNIKLDETPVHTEMKSHFHQMKMKLKHKYKPKKIQEDNTERDRQQSREQNKCINTGQGNSHSK